MLPRIARQGAVCLISIKRNGCGYALALSVASLQGDEGGGLRGAHARTAVLDGLVGDRELREVLADPKSGTAAL